jgi:hypothetical protein
MHSLRERDEPQISEEIGSIVAHEIADEVLNIRLFPCLFTDVDEKGPG